MRRLLRHIEARDGHTRSEPAFPEKTHDVRPVELVCAVGPRRYAFEHASHSRSGASPAPAPKGVPNKVTGELRKATSPGGCPTVSGTRAEAASLVGLSRSQTSNIIVGRRQLSDCGRLLELRDGPEHLAHENRSASRKRYRMRKCPNEAPFTPNGRKGKLPTAKMRFAQKPTSLNTFPAQLQLHLQKATSRAAEHPRP